VVVNTLSGELSLSLRKITLTAYSMFGAAHISMNSFADVDSEADDGGKDELVYNCYSCYPIYIDFS
jgi:hypothetical protein